MFFKKLLRMFGLAEKTLPENKQAFGGAIRLCKLEILRIECKKNRHMPIKKNEPLLMDGLTWNVEQMKLCSVCAEKYIKENIVMCCECKRPIWPGVKILPNNDGNQFCHGADMHCIISFEKCDTWGEGEVIKYNGEEVENSPEETIKKAFLSGKVEIYSKKK